MDNVNVLIADHNKDFCEILSSYLNNDREFNVEAVLHNGKEVLEYLKENKNPDILILDLIMPYLDGIGVLEELNLEKKAAEMKIIVLTAIENDKIMKTVCNLGVHYYIIKPFALNKLKIRMKQLLKKDQSLTNIKFKNSYLEIKNGNFTPLITDIIQEIGIPAHIKGYRYVRRAVEMVINDIDLLSAVTKKLYPQVAVKFNSTPSRVERAIRHAIDVAWQRGNQKILKEFFKNNLSENIKPSNSQFIAKIADKIMVEFEVS